MVFLLMRASSPGIISSSGKSSLTAREIKCRLRGCFHPHAARRISPCQEKYAENLHKEKIPPA